jgi:hypothetical protein
MKKSLIRVLLFPIAATLAVASFAFADDVQSTDGKASAETTHDVSKNPLTGNTTETTKTDTKMKVGDTTKETHRVHKKKFNKHGTKIKEENESTSESHND